MSSSGLGFVSDVLRKRRLTTRTRWRVLPSGRQALMVLAHLRKGKTYRDLAAGFGGGDDDRLPVSARGAASPRRTGTEPGAGDAGSGQEGVRRPGRTLLRIDRVAMASGRDRDYYSGKHKAHGVNAGHRRPRGPVDLGLAGVARCQARRRCSARARHPRGVSRGRGDGVRGHRLLRPSTRDPGAVPAQPL